MANRFLKVDYDKFTNKKVTSMKDEYKVRTRVINLTAKLRHVSAPDVNALVLDLNYDGPEWFFLSHGSLIININDSENIVLEPHESFTDTNITGYSSIHCVESDYYQLDQEILKKICDAQTLDFKISGASMYDIADGKSFIDYAQKFYNGFYDEEAYKEVVVGHIPTEPMCQQESSNPTTSSYQKESGSTQDTSGNGCMTTLLVAISGLSSLAICLSYIIAML